MSPTLLSVCGSLLQLAYAALVNNVNTLQHVVHEVHASISLERLVHLLALSLNVCVYNSIVVVDVVDNEYVNTVVTPSVSNVSVDLTASNFFAFSTSRFTRNSFIG